MIRLPFVIALISVLISVLICSHVSAKDNVSESTLDARIRELDGRVILRGTLRRNPMTAMLSRYVAAELRRANQKDRAEWQAIKTKQDWQQMRERRLKALRASLGQFPKGPDDLKVRVVRTTKGEGFEVDNLVFESRPGVVVTANLYRPSKPTSSMPGIVVCHSHHRPKETTARQLMGATWARAGCVVMVPDHLGHGERRQHPFRSDSDYDKPFRVSSQDYYFRYDAAIQTHLIGDSLMGWFVWDLQRGVDVLLDQRGVDAKRIIMISEPAGGGDVAAVAAALDERIMGVMVNNFGGPEPENGYPLPPDAESWFSYTTSGSWESTRNLRLSARDGFLPWTIVASVAPRRLIYYHEFYWDRQQDPVWKRFQKIYGFYEATDSLTGMAGHGFVVGSSPENTHWTPYSREVLYPTLEEWFGIPNPKKEYEKLIPEERLLCLTSPAAKQYQPVPLHRLCSQIGLKRAAAARAALGELSIKDRRATLRARWTKLLGDVRVASDPVVRKREVEQLTQVRVERIQLGTEPGIIVPVLLLVPNADQPQRVVVAVAQSGKQSFLRHRSQQIADLLHAGTIVCLLDVRGTGETDPGDGRGRRSAATSLSSSELMLGQTLVSARLRDVRQVIRYLRGRDDVGSGRISLWGDSFAPTNPADREFAVPRGIADRPHQSEPLGGLLALLTALFDEKIEAVYIHGGLSGFHDVLSNPFCYLPHDTVIPGVLAAGDLCDVTAAIAPRPLRLNGLVDGLNRRQSVDRVRKEYATTSNSYLKANAERHFSITNGQPSIARWLLKVSPTQTGAETEIGPLGKVERIKDGLRFTGGLADDGRGNPCFTGGAYGEETWLPGGEATKKAVEARRGKTPLSKLAIEMKPGTWAELETDMPERLWSAPQPSKGLHIGTWSDDAHWDTRTGQFLFFGVRQTRKFVAYSEESNAWRVIEFQGIKNAPELKQQFGHQYSKNSLDAERSHFFTGGYQYDLLGDSWVQLPPAKPGRNTMVYEYSSAMDGLLTLARQPPGTLRFYSEDRQEWSSLGVIAVHGYHSFARHNPVRQEVLFAGGNNSQAVVILSKDGKTRRMRDLPIALTVRHSVVTVDPLSGRYLIMVSPEKRLFEFDSETNEYRLIDDFTTTAWPFGRYEAPVVAYIPEYGVTMWADKKVRLYKHKVLPE